jgi:phosphatidylglycerol lysyltransferase
MPSTQPLRVNRMVTIIRTFLQRRSVAALLVLLFFGVAIWIVNRVLGHFHWSDVIAGLSQMPPRLLLMALGLTVCSYLLLSLYDLLALRYVGSPLRWRTAALVSFSAYAVAHNVGFAALSGGSVRFRIYSREGLSAGSIAQIVAFCSLTFALGACLLLGLSLVLDAKRASDILHVHRIIVAALGLIAIGTIVAYLAFNIWRTKPLPIGSFLLRLPGIRFATAQVVISSVDMCLAASVLYVLLPTGVVGTFWSFLSLYLIAVAAGLVSGVPGGLGVFESILILLLPGAPPHQMLASIVAYRVIYYVLPFLCALVILAAREAHLQQRLLGRGLDWLRAWAKAVAPQALAIAAFLSGAVLIFSGATPAADDRLRSLRHFVPLPLLEISHLVGSAVGVALLLLARGLQQRMDAAWHVTVLLLGVGIAASLIKGFDFEEALLLTAIVGAMLMAKDRFSRRASLLEGRFSVPWLVAVALVVLCSVWLGLFSFRDQQYSHELWWQFAFHADAPRMLRATMLVVVLSGVAAVWLLMRPAPPDLTLPDAAMMDRARPLLAASDDTSANLVLLGDKKLLFAPDDSGFVMFQPLGKSWVAMGDPVGAPAVRQDLVWQFREACDRYAAWPVFYQISPDNLPIYIDAGLSLSKLGEEARIELAQFGLEGPQRAELRQSHRKAQRDRLVFSVMPRSEVRARTDELRAISDAWLASKSVAEKGFSLGRFDAHYMGNFDCAIVSRDGIMVAFANIWPTASRMELSIDLMRHSDGLPGGIMDFLFIEIMLWGKGQGYSWFNLGMAPLSGLQDRSFAPIWNRMGAFLFRHGEHFYNFEGLRHYKDKFDPQWRPRYLASPGGLSTPRVLVDVTTLIAGSSRRVLMR